MTKYLLTTFLLCFIIGGLFWINVQPAAMTYQYGVHYPNGAGAINYIYGPDGTWKTIDQIEYGWNYYQEHASTTHPYNRTDLINYANGSRFTTAPDINAHLLLDLNHNGQPLITDNVAAFYEHNGKGKANLSLVAPFTNFWFDDNWVARYMSRAYGRPEPYGLSYYNDFTRWQILSGDITNWSPYNQDHFDTLALDGLYYLAKDKVGIAYDLWRQLRDKSGYVYDLLNQRYQYPNIQENYHLGLFKILTEKLLADNSITIAQQNELLQHSISLRSNILSNQERQNQAFYGWVSAIGSAHSLMNTETIAVNVLALGAGAKYSYEAGRAPIATSGNYFLRSHNVFSAVAGLSPAGYMTDGPGLNLPTGTYSIDFLVRGPDPVGPVARIEVYDATSDKVLVQQEVSTFDLAPSNQWTRLSLKLKLEEPDNRLEFRLYWYGSTNLDLALLQVR